MTAPISHSSSPASAVNSTGQRIVFLDYLRIIAFVSVLIGHQYIGQLAAFGATPPPALHASLRLLINDIIYPLAWAGGCGVILFFLVSGYIITEVLRKESAKTFCIRRLFRIYPLYIVAVLIEILIGLAHGVPCPSPGTLIPRFLLLGDFFQVYAGLNGVEWTLRAEIVFYVFMALAKATGLYERKRLFLGACLLATFGMLAVFPFPRQPPIGYTFLFMPFLFAGTAINLFKHREITGLWAFAFTVYVLVTFLFHYPIYHPDYAASHFPLIAVGLFVGFAWLGATMAYSATISFIAELTYSIYLFHNFALHEIELRLQAAGYSSRLLALGLFIALCVGFCFLIEKPAIRFGKKLSNRFAPPKATGGVLVA